jgi:hypothetical protein
MNCQACGWPVAGHDWHGCGLCRTCCGRRESRRAKREAAGLLLVLAVLVGVLIWRWL